MKKFLGNLFLNIGLSLAWVVSTGRVILPLIPYVNKADRGSNLYGGSWFFLAVIIPWIISFIDKKDETIRRFKFVGYFNFICFGVVYVLFDVIGI